MPRRRIVNPPLGRSAAEAATGISDAQAQAQCNPGEIAYFTGPYTYSSGDGEANSPGEWRCLVNPFYIAPQAAAPPPPAAPLPPAPVYVAPAPLPPAPVYVAPAPLPPPPSAPSPVYVAPAPLPPQKDGEQFAYATGDSVRYVFNRNAAGVPPVTAAGESRFPWTLVIAAVAGAVLLR